MKRTIAWLKDFFRWLNAFYLWLASEFRMVWLALFVVVLALLITFWLGASEFQIRFAGLVLQWFGLGTVVYGLQKTRKLFGHPSFLQLLREKVSRIPRWRRHYVIIGDLAGAFDVASAYSKGYVWNIVNPAAPIQEQVDALTKNVEGLKQQLIETQKEMDSKLHGHSESLRQEQKARKEGDEHLHQRLEATATGGLHISLMGAVWLFVGLFLSTISPEIAQWIK